jgi:hypothetical protein
MITDCYDVIAAGSMQKTRCNDPKSRCNDPKRGGNDPKQVATIQFQAIMMLLQIEMRS